MYVTNGSYAPLAWSHPDATPTSPRLNTPESDARPPALHLLTNTMPRLDRVLVRPLTLTLTSTPTLTCLLTELQAYTPGLDDQHVVGHMFVDRPDAFALDYNSSLFQSLQGDGVGAPVAVHPAGGGRAVRNSVTGSSPLVLHFNGGAYRMFKRPLAPPPPPPPWQCLSFAPVPLYWARLAALGDSTLSGREVVPLGA